MVGKEVKAGPLPERSKHVGTWIALLSVLLSFAVFFHKSVFLGRPLTRLGVLPHIDALYNPGLKQAVIDIGRDPTGYLMFFPNGHFVDSMWWHLVPPLWNPLIACGYPLLGDPQSYILPSLRLFK